MENDSFELLLRKDILQDTAERVELRLAIFRYLQSYHPSDTSKLDLLYISFKMYRERADTMLRHAKEIIREIGMFDGKNPQHIQKLNGTVVLLLDASDSYAKEKCFKCSKNALNLATLLSIQLKYPGMNILNLSSVEATRIFQKFSSFEDARDFVESYDLNFDIHWIDAIYHQVIENQNFTYFNDYITSFPTTSKLWVAISEKVSKMYFNNLSYSNIIF